MNFNLDFPKNQIWPLEELIPQLESLDASNFKNVGELFKELHLLPKLSDKVKETFRIHFQQVIKRQFSDTHVDSIREIVSNAFDAQTRSNSQEPIKLTISPSVLTLEDHGDGLKLPEGLFNLLIQNQSGNRLHQGPNKGTGRFGQGFLSIFSYFNSHPQKHLSLLPTFTTFEGKKSISFYVNKEGTLNKVTFFQDDINPKIEKLEKKFLDKLTFHTKSQNQSFKLKFFVHNGLLSLQIKNKEKKEQGTTIKLRSVFLSKYSEAISQSVKERFQARSSIPLLELNQEPVNGKIKEPEYRRIAFNGGDILFTALSKKKIGTLALTEKGTECQTFALSGHVLKDVFLNFDHLPLTVERRNLFYKDKDLSLQFRSLLETIYKTDTLDSKEKVELFNSLYPVLLPSRFDMLSYTKSIISHLKFQNVLKLPDTEECRNLNIPNVSYVHPHLLEKLDLPVFYQEGLASICTIKNVDFGAQFVKWNDKKILIVNESLIHHEPLFNFLLLHDWFSKKNFPIDLKKFALQQFKSSSFENLTTQVSELKQEITTESTSKFDDEMTLSIKDSTEIINNSKLNEKTKQLIIDHIELLDGDGGLILNQTHLFFLIDVFLKHGALLENCDNFLKNSISFLGDDYFQKFETLPLSAFLISNILRNANNVHVDSMQSSLETFLSFLNFNKEISDFQFKRYVLFFSKCFPFPFNNDLFFESEKVCQYLHDSQNQTVNFDQDNLENFYSMIIPNLQLAEQYTQLFNRLPKSLAIEMFANFHFLSDIHYLLKLDDNELMILINLLKNPHKDEFTCISFKEEDYKIMLHFAKEDPEIFTDYSSRLFTTLCILNQWESTLFNFVFPDNVSVKKIDFKFFNLDGFFKVLFRQLKNQDNNSSGNKIFKEFKANFDDIESVMTAIEVVYRQKKLLKPDQLFLEIKSAYSCGEPADFIRYETLIRNLETCFSNNPSKENWESIRFNCLQIWLKENLFQKEQKDQFFALMMKPEGNFLSRNFTMEPPKQLHPLHRDKETLDLMQCSAQVIEDRIRLVIDQNASPLFCLKEIMSNSIQAGATKICFEMHLTQKNELVLIVRDDGQGMDKTGLQMIKAPGHSSKRKREEVNANYGIGFFSLFSDFTQVLVCTNNEKESNSLHMVRDQNKILIHVPQETKDMPRGTTLTLLKKENKIPFLDLIRITAELATVSQYLTGVQVYCQGFHLNASPPIKPIESLEGEYSLPSLGLNGKIGVNISKQEAGIYGLDNMKLGSVKEEYLDLIPMTVREALSQNRYNFTLFLPHAEQIMNRSSLMHEKELLPFIQRFALLAALRYTLNLWKAGKSNQLLSNDFWYCENNFKLQNNSVVSSILSFLQHGKALENLAIDRELLTKAEEYFQFETAVFFPYQKGFTNFKDLLMVIKEEMDLNQNSHLYHLITEKLEDNDILINVILNLRFETPSLIELRGLIQNALIDNNLLKKSFAYNKEIIQKNSLEVLNHLVEEAVKKVKKQIESFSKLSESDLVALNEFERHIKNRVVGIKEQLSSPLMNEKQYIIIKDFVEEVLLELFDAKINVVLYDEPDGAVAKAKRQSNQISINIRDKNARNFLQLIHDFQANKSMDEMLAHGHSVISDLLETVCHEYTHIKEDSNCLITHDAKFDKSENIFRQLIFIKDSKKMHVLKILEKHLVNGCKNMIMPKEEALTL